MDDATARGRRSDTARDPSSRSRRRAGSGRDRMHFPTISRPAVSQHLRVLSDAGLVDVRPEGNRRLYRWRREGLRDAAAFVDEMWSDRLARLKAAAEREEWPERTHADRHGRVVRTERRMNDLESGVVEQTLRIRPRPRRCGSYWTDSAADVRLVGRSGRARPRTRRNLPGGDGRRAGDDRRVPRARPFRADRVQLRMGADRRRAPDPAGVHAESR